MKQNERKEGKKYKIKINKTDLSASIVWQLASFSNITKLMPNKSLYTGEGIGYEVT